MGKPNKEEIYQFACSHRFEFLTFKKGIKVYPIHVYYMDISCANPCGLTFLLFFFPFTIFFCVAEFFPVCFVACLAYWLLLWPLFPVSSFWIHSNIHSFISYLSFFRVVLFYRNNSNWQMKRFYIGCFSSFFCVGMKHRLFLFTWYRNCRALRYVYGCYMTGAYDRVWCGVAAILLTTRMKWSQSITSEWRKIRVLFMTWWSHVLMAFGGFERLTTVR